MTAILPARIIIDVLTNQENVYPTPYNGGIIDRLPRPKGSARATPHAYYTQAENPEEAGKLKNVISVLDSGEDTDARGVAINGYLGFPLVRAYVSADADGESAIAVLNERLRARFSYGAHFPRGDGTSVELVTLERQAITEGDDFGYNDRLFTTWRIQAAIIYP